MTRQSFFEGIKFAKEGLSAVGYFRSDPGLCGEHGFSIVREYVGHGIGAQMHEAPEIPNYGHPGRGPGCFGA